jgi:peroxiredoxin
MLRKTEQPSHLASRLMGCRLPSVALINFNGYPVGLERYGRGWAAIYFYSGAPSEEQPSRTDDIALHASYFHHHDDLTALRVRTLGVSTEPARAQLRRKSATLIPHDLLSDPDLRVAEALGLPTADYDGKTGYQQLALVAKDGIIERVFYPIDNQSRNASQVVAWIRHRL